MCTCGTVGKNSQAWAPRQKDGAQGMAYKDLSFPWKEIQGIWITLGTDETYGGKGASGVHRDSGTSTLDIGQK